MILSIEQIQAIVLQNPNKALIEAGQKIAGKCMLHLHGIGMETAITKLDYFENDQVHKARKEYAISNKDLFQRLLGQEDLVFAARGGSSRFGLGQEQETQMNSLLENVRYEMSLRKWIRNFALQAYRADPMGILFMEIEQAKAVSEDEQLTTPKTYPTYKSIYSIFDYLPNGRRLEYVSFQLTASDALFFGIQDEKLKDLKPDHKTDYFRFCDDEKDVIVKKVENRVIEAGNVANNPFKHGWDRTPGFIISDLVQFNNPQLFVSPLHYCVELADSFLYDRSIRDLQKKYHGFAKAVEPLLKCATCAGNGFIASDPCPDCTPKGAVKGTGYKLQTKVSDVAKFPLEIMEAAGGFDYKRIFGYVTPDIESWNKQDLSLTDLENLIYVTYWGTSNNLQQQQNKKQGDPKTATEISSNNKPKEARLNMLADWAEKTEAMLADFIGQFWFESAFKKSSIAYSRNYILETPGELWEVYQSMRTGGASEEALDDALTRYYTALYQSNPVQLAVVKKLMIVEPFVHMTVAQTMAVIDNEMDYLKKAYFGEWKRKSLTPEQVLSMKPDVLDKALTEYVQPKYDQLKADQAAAAAQETQATGTLANTRTAKRIGQM